MNPFLLVFITKLVTEMPEATGTPVSLGETAPKGQTAPKEQAVAAPRQQAAPKVQAAPQEQAVGENGGKRGTNKTMRINSGSSGGRMKDEWDRLVHEVMIEQTFYFGKGENEGTNMAG
jgi:hypothetical protein